MNPNENESTTLTLLENSNSGFERLIYQIAKTLKLKYKKIFKTTNYNDEELLDDIEKILIQNKLPTNVNGALRPIENYILPKIKKRCPESPKIFIRPEPVIIDKYEEIENDPIKKEELLKEKRLLELEKLKEKAILRKEYLKKLTQNKKLGINKLKKIEVEIPENKPHELIDKYKQKVLYDQRAKLIKKENEMYELEQKKKKEELKEKILENQRYLLKQMSDKREQKLNEIKENNFYMNKEYEDLKEYQEQQRKKNNEKIEKIREFKIDLAYAVKEKEEKKKMLKIEEDKINASLLKLNEKNNLEAIQKEKEKKQKMKEILQKAEKENLNMIKNKKNEQLKEDLKLFKINEEINKKKDFEQDIIKEKVKKREKYQNYVHNIVSKIYKIHDKQVDDYYNKIILSGKQNNKNHRNKNDYVQADNIRKNKIEELRKSLDDDILRKKQSLINDKEINLKYRNEMKRSYKNYLTEKENLKKQKMEEYEQYKKDLEEQIRENKNRELEKIRFQY